MLMVRYWYGWTPLVIVFTVIPLALPWLGLIALLLVAFVALGALAVLAGGIVFAPYMLSRTIRQHWRSRSATTGRMAPAFSAARTGAPTRLPAGATVLLANPPSEREHVT
jgi:hypothetical protein